MQRIWSCRGKAPGVKKNQFLISTKRKQLSSVSFQGNQCGSVGKAAKWKKCVQAWGLIIFCSNGICRETHLYLYWQNIIHFTYSFTHPVPSLKNTNVNGVSSKSNQAWALFKSFSLIRGLAVIAQATDI